MSMMCVCTFFIVGMNNFFIMHMHTFSIMCMSIFIIMCTFCIDCRCCLNGISRMLWFICTVCIFRIIAFWRRCMLRFSSCQISSADIFICKIDCITCNDRNAHFCKQDTNNCTGIYCMRNKDWKHLIRGWHKYRKHNSCCDHTTTVKVRCHTGKSTLWNDSKCSTCQRTKRTGRLHILLLLFFCSLLQPFHQQICH